MPTISELLVKITADDSKLKSVMGDAYNAFHDLDKVVSESSLIVSDKLASIESKTKAWGDLTIAVAQKQKILKDEIRNLISQGMDPLSPQIKTIQNEYFKLGNQYDQLVEKQTSVIGSNKTLGERMATLRDFMLGPVGAAREIINVFSQVKQKVDELENAWAMQVESEAKVNAVLKSTGAESWTTKEHILSLASSLQNASTYGDETILAMQGVLLGFTNIKGVRFDQATKAIVDMATVMKMDLASAAQSVGKALDSPTTGMASLADQGFKFTEQEKAMIKTLQDTGRIAEAQDYILKALNNTFGGAAEAVAKTSTGLKTQLHNAIGDVNEQIGRSISDRLTPFRQAWLDMATAVGAALKAQNDFKDALDRQKAGTATTEDELSIITKKYADLNSALLQLESTRGGIMYKDEKIAALKEELARQLELIDALTKKKVAEDEEAKARAANDAKALAAAQKASDAAAKDAEFIAKRIKLESDYFDQVEKINRLQDVGMITEKQASEQKLSALDAEIKGLNDLFQTDKDNSPKTLALIKKRVDEYGNLSDSINYVASAAQDEEAARIKGDAKISEAAANEAEKRKALVDSGKGYALQAMGEMAIADQNAKAERIQLAEDTRNAQLNILGAQYLTAKKMAEEDAEAVLEAEQKKRKEVKETANDAIAAIDSAAKLMQSTNENVLDNVLDLVAKVGVSSGNVIGAIVGVVAYAAKAIKDTFDATDKRREEEEKAQAAALAAFKKAQDDYALQSYNTAKEILQNKINNNKTRLDNTITALQQEEAAALVNSGLVQAASDATLETVLSNLATQQKAEQETLQKNLTALDIKQAKELDAKGLLSLSEKQALIEKKALLGEATQAELDQLTERQKIELEYAKEAQKLKDDQKEKDDARQKIIDDANQKIADAKAAAAKEDRKLMIEMAQLEKDMALAKAQIDKANAPVSTLHHKDVTGYTPEWTETVRTSSGWKDVTHKPEPIYNEWDETITQNALYDALIESIKSIEIPALASGTNFAAGGMYLVGEQGPELMRVPRGAQVIPAGQTRDIMGQGFGQQFIFNSPKPIDPFEANRLFRQSMRQMAFAGAR